VYRCLDIGSGKISFAERQGIPHHMIDEVNPDFHFDVSEFCSRAEKYAEEIRSRGKIPCFVGGTGLYIEGFFMGLSPVPEVDVSVREQLMSERALKGDAALHEELASVDPESAKRIHPNDWQRTVRALQVWRGTGKTLTWYRGKRTGRSSPDTLYTCISRDREELDRAIEKRVDGMVDAGFCDEVRSLMGQGYTADLNSMKSIGYHELIGHLEGRCTIEEAVARIKRETRDYSRRQCTWFKRYPEMASFDLSETGRLADTVGAWLRAGK
jgi:tRNA dimethylallyltransferase